MAGLAGITTPQFCHHHSRSHPCPLLPCCITCLKSSPTTAPHKNASNFQRSHPAPSHQQRSRSCHCHKECNARGDSVNTSRTTHISTDGMALLIVINPALPPPYSPRSPLSSNSFPMATPTLTPAITHLPSQVAAEPVIPWESFVPKVGAVCPRSRSFSGFDSPISAGIPPKERRFVLYLNFWSYVSCSFFVLLKDGPFHSKDMMNSCPSTADSVSSSWPNGMTAWAAAHATCIFHWAQWYTPLPLSLSQTVTKPTMLPSGASVLSPPAHASSSPASPTVCHMLVPMKSELSLCVGPSKSS